MYIQSLFEGGYGGELKADGTPATCGIPSNTVIDPTGAVVQQAWTPPLCLDDLKKNRPRAPLGREDFMKASHNLVLAGSKSTSNSSVMLGKPQLLVTNPGILYEWSIKGGSYDTRGAGVPGCPGLLVGWNRNVCWSVTAMGGDTSDLYRLSMPAANPPDTYVLDGVITPMTNVHVETIDLYGGGTTNITYQETVWGPVITEYLPQTNPPTPDQGYALCHQVLRDKSKHTIEAMLGLMTATDWCTSRAAMAKWRGPGVHFLWGDRLGNIGYTSLVSIPTRPANDPCPVSPGTQPQDGSLSASVWTGEIPFSDHPWSLNPSEGFLSTGNNLAADPATIPGNVWYGAPGDSNRSWRLRERLTELLNDTTNPSYPNIKLTPSQILAIDKDAVSPMMRVTAKLADLMLQANVLTGDAITAAQLLATWNNGLPPDQYWQFLPSITIYPYLETLAGKVGFFRAQPGQTWNALVTTYGAGASGLCNFLKHAEANLAGFAAQTDVIAWVQDRLASSYSIYINNPPTGLDQFTVYHQANAWFKAIKTPWPASILPSLEYTVTLLCPSTATIWSQPGECYKFLATMRNIDNSKAMCPPGVSENPGTATYRNHETDWLAGNMYAAPITEATVRATAISTITLFY
jgi:acyl-homoserine lactone acylase PvdQ